MPSWLSGQGPSSVSGCVDGSDSCELEISMAEPVEGGQADDVERVDNQVGGVHEEISGQVEVGEEDKVAGSQRNLPAKFENKPNYNI